MKGGSAYSRSYRRSLDFSRVREQTRGFPKNFISYATVGHYDSTPAYARVEEGDVMVECTLVPDGDEIVARLDLDTVDGGANYFPVSYGQRLIIGFPNGENGDPVVLGRCSDKSWPFPDEVAGVQTNLGLPAPAVNGAPHFAFIKTQDGQLIAIESGDGADVLIHSGGSTQIRVAPGEQNLITGRTHIGSQAEFTVPPIGASVGPDGFITQGVQGQAFIPLPNTTLRFAGTQIPPAIVPVPPPPLPPTPQLDTQGRVIPADGVVRMKDTIQINTTTSPDFFAWLSAVDSIVRPLFGGGFPPLPAGIDGAPVTASLNTCGDD